MPRGKSGSTNGGVIGKTNLTSLENVHKLLEHSSTPSDVQLHNQEQD